ncbi:MAG: hypothetical protein H6R25_3465 [Proteobacteria bacterium]|nr:hypothetical protein [Pseudomonadota bacterium]
MKQPSISIDGLNYLEHLRNIGHLFGELAAANATTTHRAPVQYSQLISLLSIMTDQLDAVIERCNQRWQGGEE